MKIKKRCFENAFITGITGSGGSYLAEHLLSEKLKTSKKLMQFIDINASINITQGMKKYLRMHRKNLKD